MPPPKTRRPPGALEALPASETTPMWLEVARRQAARRDPKDLLDQYERDRFVKPSSIDQRLSSELDALILAAASEYEALLLSPVAPLGVCSSLAPTSQDRTISAVRNLEVVSDTTNVMALECARRLRAKKTETVRLCTVHQVVRAQPVPDRPGHSQHFRLFAMAEAGPGQPNDGFEVDAIVRQLCILNRFFDLAERVGYDFPRRRAVILASTARNLLGERAESALLAAMPHLAVTRNSFESAYYLGVRVQFGAEARTGDFVPIGDLGVFDWVARLTANRKRRFVASGLGIQLLPLLFRDKG
jgi:hypothetical protein